MPVHGQIGWAALAVVALCLESNAHAEEEASEASSSAVHFEQGRPVIGATFGVGFGSGRTALAAGLSVGVPPISGVLPGIRGLLIAEDGVGGELALTLALAPPFSASILPFAIGEVGRRFVEDSADAWLFGAGGGLLIGEPSSALNFQLGWMFRRLDFPSGSLDASGPIFGVSARL
ncbi:MAG: hypothetical protein HY791_38180 [Deltaproteobacteria bacterium]|nr:hypothetical protein [Deltaproteobacteria bacterium]